MALNRVIDDGLNLFMTCIVSTKIPLRAGRYRGDAPVLCLAGGDCDDRLLAPGLKHGLQ